MSHKPNPFDFVPFVESGPSLYPMKEFVTSDNLMTGYLTVCIKALTPVHIVGDQNAVASDPKNKSKKNSKQDYKLSLLFHYSTKNRSKYFAVQVIPNWHP